PFFHAFRNIFLLIPFIVTIYLAFILDVLRAFWMDVPRRHWGHALWAVVVLGGFIWIWCVHGQSLWSTYAAAAGLLGLAALRFTGVFKANSRWLLAGLVMLAMLEPMQVF